jgi:hypothetical protein
MRQQSYVILTSSSDAVLVRRTSWFYGLQCVELIETGLSVPRVQDCVIFFNSFIAHALQKHLDIFIKCFDKFCIFRLTVSSDEADARPPRGTAQVRVFDDCFSFTSNSVSKWNPNPYVFAPSAAESLMGVRVRLLHDYFEPRYLSRSAIHF